MIIFQPVQLALQSNKSYLNFDNKTISPLASPLQMMATATTSDNNEGKTVLLPAIDLVAIYDIDTMLVYLYASGKYPTPTLTSFSRRPWPVGLKIVFEGFYLDESTSNLADEQRFAEKFAFTLNNKFNPTVVLIVVAGNEPGTEGVTKKVLIMSVPLLQG